MGSTCASSETIIDGVYRPPVTAVGKVVQRPGLRRSGAISAQPLASGPETEAPLNGPDGHLRAGLETQLAEDVGHVPHGCCFGDKQLSGDFTIATPLRDQGHDFLLTLRQWARATHFSSRGRFARRWPTSSGACAR